MLISKHNEETKKFFQKLMLFIDSAIINAVESTVTSDTNKILVSSLHNIKDALLAETIQENCILEFNSLLKEDSKKKLKEKNQESLNQEIE